MRSIDLTPLYRSTVGFDRLAQMLDQVTSGDAPAPGYPPYNIEKTGESAYRITLAVAGFGEDELNVEVKDQTLTVTARKQETEEAAARVYLHRGIAERGFERRFQLADHVKVSGAELVNGLLHIDLVREVPEALKPRTIAISTGAQSGKVIEG
ncbi:Hsp20 family protein [Limibaculum sp. FT325]|uniref:Hsp20 family protein n=1 Tax=Thermohalobaculum sediminis TaxID=2939436 RepID=UPI0020BD5D5B|nr:Hsp20 family protein [Limibaculum sediminis]MCL5778212.1 Hsp20 family protein [Limibaculum sediminis]